MRKGILQTTVVVIGALALYVLLYPFAATLASHSEAGIAVAKVIYRPLHTAMDRSDSVYEAVAFWAKRCGMDLGVDLLYGGKVTNFETIISCTVSDVVGEDSDNALADDDFPLRASTIEVSSYLKGKLNRNLDATVYPDRNVTVAAKWDELVNASLLDRIGEVRAAEFSGFVAAAYRVPVPEWWTGVIADTHVVQTSFLEGTKHILPPEFVGGFDFSEIRKRWINQGKWSVSGQGTVSGQEEILTIADDRGRSVALRVDEVYSDEENIKRGAKWNERLFEGNFVVHFDADLLFFAVQVGDSDFSSPDGLCCVSVDSGKIKWISGIWAAAMTGGTSGGQDSRGSYSEIVTTPDVVALFGGNAYNLYVNVFDKESGNVLYGFATQWIDWPEVWEFYTKRSTDRVP